jgi:hypothetical protein
MRTLFTTVLVLTLAMAAHAQVYKRVDKYGNVTYSDEPAPDSKKIRLPQIQFYTPPKRKTPKADAADAAATAAAEKKPAPMPSYVIQVANPVDDDTVISNAGTVQVTVTIDPALRPTETITIYLDGQPIAQGGSATSATATFVDRGSHTVRASVLDSNGTVVATSAGVKFFLKRFFKKAGS